MAPNPTLSVIIPTRRGWPATEPALASVADQAAAVGGEVLIMDSSGLPAPSGLAPHVSWVPRPTDESVFKLRAAGYQLARGEIVAVTEDHCRATPDWCRRILERHAEHPEAAAIGGAVDNGTPDHPIDWAAFIVTQFPYAAPLPNGPVKRTTSATNLSFKRRAVDRIPKHAEFGAMEIFDTGAILSDGDVLFQDDSIVVLHDQSMGFGGTSATEFHNGRLLGGFRRGIMDGRDWLRIGAAGIMPFYRSARAVRVALGKRLPRQAVVSAIPYVVWLELCTSAGELVGYASGPGDSPSRLR